MSDAARDFQGKVFLLDSERRGGGPDLARRWEAVEESRTAFSVALTSLRTVAAAELSQEEAPPPESDGAGVP